MTAAPPRNGAILAAVCLAAFAINLDSTIVNVALPKLALELHASNSQLQWVVDAFNLFFAASVLVAGSLSDRFGRQGLLLAGLAVFGLASLVGGITSDPGELIAADAVGARHCTLAELAAAGDAEPEDVDEIDSETESSAEEGSQEAEDRPGGKSQDEQKPSSLEAAKEDKKAEKSE